jgi:hypothetical protein
VAPVRPRKVFSLCTHHAQIICHPLPTPPHTTFPQPNASHPSSTHPTDRAKVRARHVARDAAQVLEHGSLYVTLDFHTPPGRCHTVFSTQSATHSRPALF